jgi:pSer/pThr/pTyr-binding forkhead associated (FHA) protein
VKIGGEMARLVLDCDGVDVITHELIGDVITIGRAPSNDVVIDDPTVSTQHASLTKSASGYRLKDLGSTNGTQINGVSITDAELKDGAEIRFGYVTGVFRDATASIEQARDLQVPGEHDCPTRIRVSETQSIFCPRAASSDEDHHDAHQQQRDCSPA